jgi:hypothetical protein
MSSKLVALRRRWRTEVATHRLAHHQRRLGDTESAAAELLRNRDAEITGVSEGAIEVVRELMARIALALV